MKPSLLFLAHRIPYPPNKGDKIRSFNELDFLSKHFDVRLGCLVDNPEDFKHVKFLQERFGEVGAFGLSPKWARLPSMAWDFLRSKPLSVSWFRNKALLNWTRKQWEERRPDAVFIFSGQMAQYLPREALKSAIIDFCDVDSHKWSQYADRLRGIKAWFFRREAERLLAFEKGIASDARATLLITAAEKDLFLSLGGKGKIEVLGNGVDTDFFAPKSANPEPGRLLFTGAMDYYPNEEGVVWFVEEVLPKLLARNTQVKFVIAGSRPTPRVQALAGEHVEVTGFVEDMRKEQARAEIAVVPIRIARGMQNKVLEAMACGKPVVATPNSLGGISARHGQEIKIAESAKDFAHAVQELLEQAELRAQLGRSARVFAVETYSWNRNLERDLLPLFRLET
jgi:sugar transferase (PEP-CTERM/EpsH1 system associated)